jgi:hypothetical protein
MAIKLTLYLTVLALSALLTIPAWNNGSVGSDTGHNIHATP